MEIIGIVILNYVFGLLGAVFRFLIINLKNLFLSRPVTVFKEIWREKKTKNGKYDNFIMIKTLNMLLRTIFIFLFILFLTNCREGNKKNEPQPQSVVDSSKVEKIEVKTMSDDKIGAKMSDTVEIEDNEFMIEATYSVLDYYVVKRDFDVDTLSVDFKPNHINEKQIDTLLMLRINGTDTLNYYLAQKSILTDASIYSKKVVFSDSIRIGKTFDEIKSKFDQLEQMPAAQNIKINDFEGFGHINLSFKNDVLTSIKFESMYLD